jgi:lysyl endopeptidase
MHSKLVAALRACSILAFFAVSAQAEPDSILPSLRLAATLPPLAAVDRLEIAGPSAEVLEAESVIAEPRPQIEGLDLATIVRPTRFALALPLEVDFGREASWVDLDTGERLGRLRLASPGALSVNLTFERFLLGAGAEVWIYSPDGRRLDGPFTAQDGNSGRFWTPLVLGSEIVVEVLVPVGSFADLHISAFNFGFRDFGQVPTKAGSCNIDVACPQASPYRNQVRAVARYTLNGVDTCSGTLLNNTAQDRKPYFLTAAHCQVTSENASSMVIYWNFESPSCGQLGGGSLDDNQSGAIWRAGFGPSDFTLVELEEMPDSAFEVYYAGWDATVAVPHGVVGIHHPDNDEKTISIENDALVSTFLVPSDGFTHWKVVNWDAGVTEGGSSGSCIFTMSTKRCVGTLTGGFSGCGPPFEDLEDYYGKFTRHWLGGLTTASALKPWLDPVNSGVLVLDGLDGAPCVANASTACLDQGRFRVKIKWETAAGTKGNGQVVPAGSDSTAIFYFFDPENWEILIKVLDGCALNNRFWVFAAATTDVGYTIEVFDSVSRQTKLYVNELGRASPAITDTQAFASCS